MRLSPTTKHLKPSPTLAVSAKASQLRAEGVEVLNMSLGEPDFPTPEPVRDAAKRAIDEGHTRYTAVAGMMPLRERISQFLHEQWQLSYKPQEVLVSTGAKQCLYNAIHALIGPGDEVIIPTPYWVSYPTQVEMAGGTPVYVNAKVEDDFQIDPAALEAAITPYTKMLVLNSPNNPTGAVYSRSIIEAITAMLERHPQIWLLTDEIYNRLVYGGVEALSPLQLNPALKERSILINGFSKAYAMTGWRMGYMAAPQEVISAANSIQGAITSGPNSVTQWAAIAALDLDPSVIEEMRQAFEVRLGLMQEGFEAIPKLRVPKPQGAFYLMPDFSAYLGNKTPKGETIEDTLQLSTYLLEQGRVAAVPGEAFGMPGTIRFSYATDQETIKQVIAQVKQTLETLS